MSQKLTELDNKKSQKSVLISPFRLIFHTSVLQTIYAHSRIKMIYAKKMYTFLPLQVRYLEAPDGVTRQRIRKFDGVSRHTRSSHKGNITKIVMECSKSSSPPIQFLRFWHVKRP